MADNPGINLGESQEIIIFKDDNALAKAFNFELPDGSTVGLDPTTDTITTGK